MIQRKSRSKSKRTVVVGASVVGFADGLFDGWFEGPDVGDEDGAAVGV